MSAKSKEARISIGKSESVAVELRKLVGANGEMSPTKSGNERNHVAAW